MPSVSFDEVKAKVNIRQAAAYLDIKWKGAHQSRTACPKCEPDSSRQRELVLTESTDRHPNGAYYCWVQKTGGDALAFVGHVLDLPIKDAALWLAERAGMVSLNREHSTRTSNPDRGTVPNTKPQSGSGGEVRAFQPLSNIEPHHEAVEAIGFDPADAERLGIGFQPKGSMAGHVLVPVRLPDGSLVGYLGIIEAKLPKAWHWPTEAEAQPAAENVFPLRPKKPA